MSVLKGFGDNMATLSPEGQQGLMVLMSGLGQQLHSSLGAMDAQAAHMGDALGAYRGAQDARAAGYQAANQRMFGSGPGSASSQLGTAIQQIAPMLNDRSNDLATAMENAQAAYQQEDAMRTAGTRAPGGGGAFEQAQANQGAADAARAQGREAATLGGEGVADAMRGMQERYGEGLYGVGRAQLGAGMEKDLGQIRGAGGDALSQIHGWQAGQVRPQYNPLASLAQMFGPRMLGQGLAQGRARRQSLMGGGRMPQGWGGM